MMDWVPAFYARQHELLGDVDRRGISPAHREIAATVHTLVSPPARVLELGAGHGQVAAALADMGYEVVAIELLLEIAAHAQALAAFPRTGKVNVLEGNFYEIETVGTFDVVGNWDGFGIGEDSDQRRLLRRVREWLSPGGRALFEVYTPWYWAQVAGRTMTLGKAVRRYGFDGYGNRMLDSWWQMDEPAHAVTQSLRCYAPANLHLLLEGTGLTLFRVTPGGHFDAAAGRYEATATLERAMSYVATLAAAP